jgi:hypothetical protein
MIWEIDLIFDMRVYNHKLQIKFEIRSDWMIFGQLTAIGLWNLAKYLVVSTFFICPSRDGPFHRGIMWSSLVKIQYTELKLSCGNDPVVNNSIYSNGDLDLWPNDPKISNFSSVYQIFIKLGHMIPLWKGKNPIYFGVIRSKGKVTVTINIIFDNRIVL